MKRVTLLLLLAACQSASVGVRPAKARPWTMTKATRAFLDRRGLDVSRETVASLDRELRAGTYRDLQTTLAEICYELRADPLMNNSCLVYAYPRLAVSGVARELYNRALANILRRPLPERLKLWNGELALEKPPMNFVDFKVAADFEVEGLTAPDAGGIGVPCIVLRNAKQERLAERFRVGSPYARPTTAFLHIKGNTARIELRELFEARSVRVLGRELKLAYDAITPLAFNIAKQEWPDGNQGLLSGSDWKDVWGLYIAGGPHRRGRSPVVFVHGLKSSPTTWIKLYDALRQDAEVTARYEFWFFHYPTGFPVLVAADALRGCLKRARSVFDDPALDGMVVVGHSMGGLLAKAVVQKGGDRLWGNLKPIDQLDLSKDDKEWLLGVIHFEPLPFVKRAVFICAPHRGSTDADRLLVRVTADLFLKFPPAFRAREARIRKALGESDRFTSIRSLSAKNPALHAMARTPIAVPFHTIVGAKDDVVPYYSAHLEGARSEFVVKPAGHGAPWYPECWAEVRRILMKHGHE